MYVVYIGSDKIRIVEASTSFGKVFVKSLFSQITPNDYLDNPTDKAFAELSNVIADGLTQINGKGKTVRVVLENGTIPFTEKTIPSLSQDKTIKMVINDIFSDEKLIAQNVVDYIEIERFIQEEKIEKSDKLVTFLGKAPKKKEEMNEKTEEPDDKNVKVKKVRMSNIFFTYVAKDIIKHLEKFFKDLGYKLMSIDIYQNAMRKLIGQQIALKKRNPNLEDGVVLPDNMVIVEYKDDAITLFLFKDGKMGYTFRKTLMSSMSNHFQSERLYFIAELTQTISEALQFFRSKNPGLEYDGVYITGVLNNFDSWGGEVSAKITYDLKPLGLHPMFRNVDEMEYNEFSGALAGFIRK